MSAASGRVAVGHPIDVATGTLYHEFTDFMLPGRVPLSFRRRYSTARIAAPAGMLGAGWSSPLEARLRRDLDGYRLLPGDSDAEIAFDDPEDRVVAGGTVVNLGACHELRRDGARFVVTQWDLFSAAVVRFLFEEVRGQEGWHLAGVEDLAGRGYRIERDGRRVTAVRQDREQRGYRLVYDGDGRVTEVYQTAGAAGPSGRLAEQQILRCRYNAAGLLAECLDPADNRGGYEYDAAGRLRREVTACGMVYHFRYDDRGRCVHASGLDNFDLQSLQFDDLARMTRVTNALDEERSFFWNEAGQVELEISPLGHAATTVYDARGRLCQVTRPGDLAQALEYDDRGNLARMTGPGALVSTYEHNDRHQRTALIDGEGFRWQWTYDRAGRVASATDPVGRTWSCSYDERGDPVAVTDPGGGLSRFRWDEAGNLAASTDAMGHATRREFDPFGNLTALIDPFGNRWETRLNALGQVRELRLPGGARRAFAWNVYGQLTEYVDERGGVSRCRYAPCGFLTEYARPDGGRVELKWAPVPGRMLEVRNERGERHRCEHDAEGNVVAETDFAGRRTRYGYDPAGRVVWREDALGQLTRLKWAAEGVVTEVSHEGGPKTAFAFDGRGLLLKADNGAFAVEYQYDGAGRVVLERQGGHEMRHAYDAAGNRLHRRSSVGPAVGYEWNALGLPTRLRFGGVAVGFEYDARMSETARTLPSGTRLQRAFDAVGRCVEQRVLASGARSWIAGSNWPIHRRFRYDPAGNLLEVNDLQRGLTRYEYDDADHIQFAQAASGLTEWFRHDAAGNLSAYARQAGPRPGAAPGLEDWVYGAGNELARRDGVAYTHNALGQLTRKVDRRGETHYTWDRDGLLAGVTLPDGSRWAYHYDAFGRRVKKCGPGGVTEYVWDRDVVYQERHTPAGGTPRSVFWAFHPFRIEPVARVEGDSFCLCVNDPLGTPRELIDAAGTVKWAGALTTLGQVHQLPVADVDCPVRFPGQWFDAETGLHYNRFRYYDPETGRYISPDPIGFLGNLNLFAYGPNTTGWCDPYGLAKAKTPKPCKKNPPPLLNPIKSDVEGEPHGPGTPAGKIIDRMQSGNGAEGTTKPQGQWTNQQAAYAAAAAATPPPGAPPLTTKTTVPIPPGAGVVHYLLAAPPGQPAGVMISQADRALVIPKPNDQVHTFPIDSNHPDHPDYKPPR
jgi:RHS repeat-associated protein